jgi:hypothetical protein
MQSELKLITYDEARKVALRMVEFDVPSKFRERSLELLEKEYFEAEHCWMFFRSRAIALPSELALSDFAYCVSKNGTVRAIPNYSSDTIRAQEYCRLCQIILESAGYEWSNPFASVAQGAVNQWRTARWCAFLIDVVQDDLARASPKKGQNEYGETTIDRAAEAELASRVELAFARRQRKHARKGGASLIPKSVSCLRVALDSGSRRRHLLVTN